MFRRGGAGKKRDAIEPAVIRELKARGVQVFQISGRALPDLLTYHQGVWLPLGLKSGAKARLTALESSDPPLWPLVVSVEQAVEAVCESSRVSSLRFTLWG